ncbi:beta-carotene 15,15'-monooxygenase, partial [Actinotignum timonense]|nr:beta-carotene 15,15'-monooxygenase [Actinotignum timonense]
PHMLGAVLIAELEVHCLSFPSRRGALGAVVALNIASEKISFSRVIATHPWLRALDQAGRA